MKILPAGNRAIGMDKATVTLALTERAAELIAQHNLAPEIAAAADRAARKDVGEESPLEALAIALLGKGLPALCCRLQQRAVILLQRFARGHLIRNADAFHISDRRSHTILRDASRRRSASVLLQAQVRRRSKQQSFISLQTALKTSSSSAFDNEALSRTSQDRITLKEYVDKEMERLEAKHLSARSLEKSLKQQGSSGSTVIEAWASLLAHNKSFEGQGEVTLSNPYEGVDFSNHAGGADSRWWKVGLHNHGPNGEEQLGFFPYTKVACLLSDAGYRAVCIVEHEHFVTFSYKEAFDLETACSEGGSCEGLVIFTGAEGRSKSAWGEHITFVTNQPDLLIATHPNTIMNDGMDQVSASRFTDDSSFEHVNFIEIFNAWGRHFKPR